MVNWINVCVLIEVSFIVDLYLLPDSLVVEDFIGFCFCHGYMPVEVCIILVVTIVTIVTAAVGTCIGRIVGK